MNPYLESIRLLEPVSERFAGRLGVSSICCSARLGDGFGDSGNNVHTRNPPKEALRRIALIDGTGHGYQRLAVTLESRSIIAYDRPMKSLKTSRTSIASTTRMRRPKSNGPKARDELDAPEETPDD